MFASVFPDDWRRRDEIHSADRTLAWLVHANLRVHGTGPYSAFLVTRMVRFGRAVLVRPPAAPRAQRDTDRERKNNGRGD
jgi:hypothetical protein